MILLPADLYIAVAETTDHGYPIREHFPRLLPDGDATWRLPSTAPFWSPRAAATTNCTSVRIFRSATYRTTQNTFSSTCLGVADVPGLHH